ncbi:DUF397 domain-containing protein [Amycolatopsis antarctica]|uniref:DUF397 domain-containing protein n=1 Tax=Amycolatopsis antarctica TaxID=1854586 RepID=A0A263D9V3_9PSEU|nr:DUF397 domain-containing protein [Amycolatopsis antarctica]OZM75270.1 DUF397 domain-containing protein [Amycolatopsis antarctica]
MSSKSSLRWRKSSYSGNANGNCVEVVVSERVVHVRDSKAPLAGVQRFSPRAWSALLAVVR